MEMPDAHYGRVKEDNIDWRKDNKEALDDDSDEPISDDVKAILGFDPDKETEEVKDELEIKNSDGIIYKDYSIKQNSDGSFEVCSVGGSFIDNFSTLELAMNRINEISI
jgi:hypothetical protein